MTIKPGFRFIRVANSRALRRQRTFRMFMRTYTALLAVIGGASGILIGAILVNYFWPGHPVYTAIQDYLRDVLR